MKHYHANHQNGDDTPLIKNEFQSRKKINFKFKEHKQNIVGQSQLFRVHL